eukprot:scaffold310783_cov31-Attheya_sp.AAC.1
MMNGNVWTDVSLAMDCNLNQGEFYFLIFICTLLLMMDRDNERYSIYVLSARGDSINTVVVARNQECRIPSVRNAGFPYVG